MAKSSKAQLLLYTSCVLADLLDTYIREVEVQLVIEKAPRLDFALRHTFNTIIANTKKLYHMIDRSEDNTASDYGDACDKICAIFSLLIDRTGEDDKAALDIYEYIKSKPSSLGMEFKGLDEAFNDVKHEIEKE